MPRASHCGHSVLWPSANSMEEGSIRRKKKQQQQQQATLLKWDWCRRQQRQQLESYPRHFFFAVKDFFGWPSSFVTAMEWVMSVLPYGIVFHLSLSACPSSWARLNSAVFQTETPQSSSHKSSLAIFLSQHVPNQKNIADTKCQFEWDRSMTQNGFKNQKSRRRVSNYRFIGLACFERLAVWLGIHERTKGDWMIQSEWKTLLLMWLQCP